MSFEKYIEWVGLFRQKEIGVSVSSEELLGRETNDIWKEKPPTKVGEGR